MKIHVIVITTLLIQTTKCVKILGVFPFPMKSHYILGSRLMRGLAEKGHDVTVINPFGEKNPPKNGSYRDILIGPEPDKKDELGFNPFEFNDMSFIGFQLFLGALGNAYTEEVLKHPNVQKLLQSNETFDVVIVEQCVNDALKVFAYHYKAPLVIFSTFTSNAWVNPLVGNPAPPSYIPEQNIELDHRKFSHRVRNVIVNIFGELFRNFIFFPRQNRIMKKYFPEAPDLKHILYNASLVLVNSHLSTNKAMPRVPNMVDIGGFHLKPPKKLPQELQQYLDDAKEGVIYFSMGSALQSTNFPDEKRDAILKVFSKLKCKVLWKWESDVLPGQPPNVKLAKWLPQQDVLGHPNIKVFITHGGLLGLTESVYHGVPVLAIPVFGDQVMNAAESARNGLGRYILNKDLNEETLSEALDDVLHNGKYRENMKKRSKIMHDRQRQPIDDADYWIQYVIRHQGAPHLRVAGLELAWYQYLCLDVAVFICGSILLVSYLVLMTLKFIVYKLKQPVNDEKMKRN